MIDPASMVTIPAGAFLLGGDYGDIQQELRDNDRRYRLGLGSVLASTPGVWVDQPEFRIQSGLVTNGEYQKFWTSEHPNRPGVLAVDDAELWAAVWDMYGIGQVKVPAGIGAGAQMESYQGCQGAIDALLRSYALECQRILLGYHLPPSERGFDTQSIAIVRLFAAVRRALQAAISGDEPLAQEHGASESLSPTDTGATYLEDADRIQLALQERLSSSARMPLMILLRRIRRLLEPQAAVAGAEIRLLVSQVFRPLFWPDGDRPKGGGTWSRAVAWQDLPIVGVSLYEAAAFTLAAALHADLPLTLPSEAEWEKAFAWRLDGTGLDPARKHLYPWQGRTTEDFNLWFSRDGHAVSNLESKQPAWKKLVEDTSRVLPGGARLVQGLGFGWQWTRDRFNHFEQKYNRFQQAGIRSRQEQGRTIYTMSESMDPNLPHFAVRGAPDQLGGPGVTTRRYALYPLRGYAECSFRCAVAGGEG